MKIKLLLFVFHTQTALYANFCINEQPKTFHLIKRCQRSKQIISEMENVGSLEECFKVAEKNKALALNYSPLRGRRSNFFVTNSNASSLFPRRTNRKHFLDQTEEFFNCHALQCPESSAYLTMVNDSRFDYYSLYGNPPEPQNFTCAPEIGIFQLNPKEENYKTAAKLCNQTSKGALAHIVSEKRTIALSKLLQGSEDVKGMFTLAYVGLNYTILGGTQTSEKEYLNCFLYRAWAPGHPKRNGSFLNSSCVALSNQFMWMTIDCDKKLPFICEIYTAPLNVSHYSDLCEII